MSNRRIPGQFVPSDVDLAYDPDIMAAGPMAELIYRRANEYAKKNRRDGIIYTLDLPVIARAIPNPEKHAARLVDRNLWEQREDGWLIRSYLKWNLSLDEQAAAKQANRIGAAKSNHGKGLHITPDPICPLCEEEQS